MKQTKHLISPSTLTSRTLPLSSLYLAKQRRSQNGFALVVALSLMAFVVLLLLSLTSLVRVSTEVSARQVDVLLARQNALLSMQVALGKLQQYTGPDQRVTALSGSLEGGTTSEVGSIQPGSQHWVGVWDSDPDSSSYGIQLGQENAVQAEWLISKGDELNPLTNDPVAASGVTIDGLIPRANAESYALLLGPGDLRDSNQTSVLPNVNDFVVAPTLPIEDVGSFAYWVSDEGQKAKIIADLHEEEYTQMTDEEISHRKIAAPQRSGVEAIAGLSAFGGNGDVLNSDIKKLNSFDDAALISLDPTLLNTIKTNYHALSLSSKGVLTDVKNGGLKKDLTHEFHPTLSKDELKNEQIFGTIALTDRRFSLISTRPKFISAENNRTSEDLGGPYWDQLRSYANAKPEDGVIEFQPHSDYSYGVMPVVTQIKWYYHAIWVNHPGNQIGARFIIMPLLVFNNPYPYTLRMPDTYMQVLHGPTSNKGSTDPLTGLDTGDERCAGMKIRVPGGGYFTTGSFSSPEAENFISELQSGNAYVEYLPDFQFNPNVGGHKPSYITYTISAYDFPPGATRVFSPTQGLNEIERDINNLNNPATGLNRFVEGNFGGSGFYIDVPGRFNVSDLKNGDIGYLPPLRIEGEHSNDIHVIFGTETEISTRNEVGSGQYSVVKNPFKIIYRLGAYGLADGSHVFTKTYRPAADKSPLTAVQGPSFGFDHSLRLPVNYWDSATGLVQGGKHKIAWLAQYNPAANFSMRTPLEWRATNWQGNFNTNPSYIGGTVFNSLDYAVQGPFFGAADTVGGSNEVILFDLPSEENPLTSIGQLMHANPSRNFDFDFNQDGEYVDDMLENYYYDEYYYGNNIQPAYAIGNSLASGKIADRDFSRDKLTETYLSWLKKIGRRSRDGNGLRRIGVHYDYSYLLNDALWDSYFFSSLDFDEEDFIDKFPHKNGRMIKHGDPSSVEIETDGFNKSAANLMVDGAFNVNSTSKKAWMAILASYLNVGKFASPDEASFQRLVDPLGTSLSAAEGTSSANAYIGYRRLTLAEIESLAEEIVTENRRRMQAYGSPSRDRPYLSMSEFVNRTLNTRIPRNASDMRLKGPLQAAIDETNINTNFDLNAELIEASSSRRAFGPTCEAHAQDYVSRHLTTYLSQADILARLGSILSVRSDTFKVRAYGDARDPTTGEINSKVWCEAIVQRIPDYVSDEDEPDIDPDDPTFSLVNQKWGRRCKIVSVRWLTEDDILN
jgi:hypothetical protein